MTGLRDYQLRAIEGLRQSLRSGHRRPMLAAPTGAGKTKIASAVVQNALEKDKRVAFCVPALSLIDQTIRAFYDDGIDRVGVQQGDHPMWRPIEPVQVCSVQTLERRELPTVDVVIIDEAHIMRKRIFDWMGEKPELPFVGLSATPWSRGLGQYYDDLIVAASTKELIDQGWLSAFKVYAPSRPDLSGVRTQAGEWHAGDLAALVQRNDKALVGDVLETWQRLGRGRPTVCFCVDRAHANMLAVQFQQAGVASAYVDCFTSRQDREDVRWRFHAGLVEVVFNVDCLGIGVDWDIRCVILARPHKSEMAYVQKIGRGLRTADGKDHCLVIDHSSTTERLGFVDEIGRESLDDGAPRQAADREVLAKPPVPCPVCARLMAATTFICPECGHERPKPLPTTTAEYSNGALVLLDRKHRSQITMDEKIDVYSQLLGHSRARGYKDGWAAYAYRELFGVWPNNMRWATPQRPSAGVLNWIRWRNIRNAKAKER